MTVPRSAEPRPQGRRRSRPLLLLADFGVALALAAAELVLFVRLVLVRHPQGPWDLLDLTSRTPVLGAGLLFLAALALLLVALRLRAVLTASGQVVAVLALGAAFLFGASHYTPTPPTPDPLSGSTPCRSGSSCN
ncbi:hypothetical protein Kpho02_00090 [Kitasatospora phosalacinea]|uniref:DUF6234 domain-containing protein n=1 Tax=Kitasatospora phosalacinea TaxID=2065 RepID=A0A9W6Q0K2_9ACTN|nr:DUF6234 family protein [Kitasatospora phosalacinea]GLW67710.1 hypothetical protein Kpho02_00090 [Kitasatospora phosalacinea]